MGVKGIYGLSGSGIDVESMVKAGMMKVAEGAVSSTVEILKTLKEKVVNAANATNTDADRATIQKELDQSIDQIDDNANVTFNGQYLVDGSHNSKVASTTTTFTNTSMQGMLLAALLAITADRERGRCILELCQGMFTEQMQALLQRFAGGEDRLSQNVWEAYSAFLPLVGGAGNEVLLEDYARMALDFSWAEVCKAADKLRELGQPAAAWILYSSVPQDAAVLTADFWHQAAVCAYQLRQFAVAEECFQKAEEQGCVRKDIAAYRKWMQEAQVLR